MFIIIIIPPYAQISGIKLTLKSLRHVSVLIHHLQEFTVVLAKVMNF